MDPRELQAVPTAPGEATPETGAPDLEGGGKAIQPPSPVLKAVTQSAESSPEQLGGRPLRDSDPLERNPWESFFNYTLFGLFFAIVLPFFLQLFDEFRKQKLEIACGFGYGNVRAAGYKEEDCHLGRVADLGVVLPWALRVSASSFFPPWGLVAGVVIACVFAGVMMFCYRSTSKVLDQYLTELFTAAHCCAGQGSATQSLNEGESCASTCWRVCRKLLFLAAFSTLPLAAWGGRSLWKAVASQEYYICQLVCSNEVQHEMETHENTTLYNQCKDNNMARDPPPNSTLWETDSLMAVITEGKLVFPPKDPSKYKGMCAELFAMDHSHWGDQMLKNQHNFTAFEGLLFQSKQIGVLEIYGPPFGVAWLIMMVASRLALRRKLTSLNAARKLFMKQYLVSKSTEYVWLFSHMYFLQGMKIEDIRRTWVVRRLKDADPYWQDEETSERPWLTVTSQMRKMDGTTTFEDAPQKVTGQPQEEGKEQPKERPRRRPKHGDEVEVRYEAYWLRKDEGERVGLFSSEPFKFVVDEKGQVIDAFHLGIRKMRFPSGDNDTRTCDVAKFEIDLDLACNAQVSRAVAGFDYTERRKAYADFAKLVYKVTLIDGTPREEEDDDADGFSDAKQTSWKMSMAFIYATPWSISFALGFTLIPGLVRALNAMGSSRSVQMYGILSTPELVPTLFFNTVVIFVTNGLVFFGFVRAYFALNDKLQTMLAFDCMWQFPEEHLLHMVEDSTGVPLLQDAQGWLKVLKKVDETKNQPSDPEEQRAREETDKLREEFFDHSGYRARFTPQSLDDKQLLKKNLNRLDEWFNMRRYLQIDAYDERISLELAMVVTLITLVPEVAVVAWNFQVLSTEKSRVQPVNVLALWNFMFSLFFLFRYLMVTLKFNDAYDRHIEQIESLRSHVELVLAKKPNLKEGKLTQRVSVSAQGASSAAEATLPPGGPDSVDLPEEVALLCQYLSVMRKSGSFALFFGFKVDRRLVSGYLSFAALSVLTQVFPILRDLSGGGDE